MQQGTVCGERYQVQKKLGEGSFGQVYLMLDLKTGKNVAAKMEPANVRGPQLPYEKKLYEAFFGEFGFPNLKWFGVSVDQYSRKKFSVLVCDLLGSSLEDLFNKCGRRFTPMTVLLIGEQVIARLQTLHKFHYVHRDIKPDNFLIGRDAASKTIHIIDFGLSKRYRDPKTYRHAEYSEGHDMTGTPRYASINNHLGAEQSRRDDMESVGYMLVYLALGKLPWQGLQADTPKKKHRKIAEVKLQIKVPDLCRGCPWPLRKYLDLTRSMRYEDQPDYQQLIECFSRGIDSGDFGDRRDGFDWERPRRW
uniref:Casein kinase I n=1 Tax=Aplanochytrium stocchinoi TaxID=215587 RepID=A0A7S3PH47_9STRA|mmetsp:Transcript_19347/g.23541  ORF Transcript_19347/g.23541 Transcript_19347/m.23541 type:complete len:306 (+) Transcript_19347:350-1267(+)|eukprot:CAMPEP_0204825792 /NCGR_PEP_ID=MMETSP1346-20131115/3597_1 /ASSEMBLY_ACC=CAM_ASM_000771 /TAXON_ID=215587 /ORGANISM="Aplanochytrium stocchinoi, Strain GSBS06" /LENGTH=305 /DNA_ID=CAMNT_0051953533 /DNA_START=379 /DNA_END=1296 /DNA_ORIENTATION=-